MNWKKKVKRSNWIWRCAICRHFSRRYEYVNWGTRWGARGRGEARACQKVLTLTEPKFETMYLKSIHKGGKDDKDEDGDNLCWQMRIYIWVTVRKFCFDQRSIWWILNSWFRASWFNVNKKVQLDATVCRHLFTAKSLYMFRASQHPSSGVLKTVSATSGIGHDTGTATSFWHGLIRPRRKEVVVPVSWPIPEVADTVFSTPDDGCCDAWNM